MPAERLAGQSGAGHVQVIDVGGALGVTEPVAPAAALERGNVEHGVHVVSERGVAVVLPVDDPAGEGVGQAVVHVAAAQRHVAEPVQGVFDGRVGPGAVEVRVLLQHVRGERRVAEPSPQGGR